MKSLGSQRRVRVIIWMLCVVGLGIRRTIVRFKDLKQVESLEAYIQNFDISCNMVEINDKRLVFFMEGLEMKIKT